MNNKQLSIKMNKKIILTEKTTPMADYVLKSYVIRLKDNILSFKNKGFVCPEFMNSGRKSRRDFFYFTV